MNFPSEREKQVEKIVNSLIVKTNRKNKKRLHHISSSKYLIYKKKKDKFPIKNSISPASYIDFNLKKSPEEKSLFRSFNIQLKTLNNNMEYRQRILNQADANYRNRKKVEKLKNQHNNDFYSNFIKRKVEKLFLKNDNDNKQNLHFNLYDYYNNIHKMKVNNRFQYNNKNIGNLKKEFKNNLINFDKKMKTAEISTIKAVKHLDSLSQSNNKMMKEVLDIYNIFNEFEK